ncbi:hypothetical protein ABFS82_14G011700 [Erythranthe guttata]
MASSLVFLAAAITTIFAVASSPTLIASSSLPQLLSPEIAPLLPSTRGDPADPPTGSFMPTIPSSRSPPNPDLTGLDTAFAPFGLLQESSAVSRILVKGLGFGALLSKGFLCSWLLVVFIV